MTIIIELSEFYNIIVFYLTTTEQIEINCNCNCQVDYNVRRCQAQRRCFLSAQQPRFVGSCGVWRVDPPTPR